MTLARDLAAFLNRVTYAELPPAAIEHAKMVIASTLASAAPGHVIDSARIIRELAEERGGARQATVWFDGGTKLPVTEAARVNATLSDAAASDDSDMRNIAHTGTIATSVSLAVAESTGASGRDVLAAMVAGYEASGRIGEAISPGLGERGMHACVITVFSGAVAAGRLLGLTDEQLAHALCLAATSIGGIAISTNSLGREYHAGWAALSGVNAAMVAQRGYTGLEDIFEARRGFLESLGGRSNPEVVLKGLGEEWDIVTHLMIKLRPGAHPLSAAVEAAIDAAREGNVDPAQVQRIVVSGPRIRAPIGRSRPTDLVGAIHSLAYFLASAVADREFGWQHATAAKIADPAIGRLQELVEVDANPPEGYGAYTWGYGATVTIEMNDGAKRRATVNAPIGSGPRGIEWRDVEAKYRALMPASGLTPERIEEALSVVRRFESVSNVAELTGLLG